jgi:3',5'-cyclic AMP phosphodiesterase CpdA
MRRITLALLIPVMTGCSVEAVVAALADGSANEVVKPAAVAYPLDDSPWTTLQAVWAPRAPSLDTVEAIGSRALTVTEAARFEEFGLGATLVSGETWLEVNDLAPGWASYVTSTTAAAAERASLLWFWQSADPQLIDEESPIRFEGVYALTFGSTYRPQDHLITQVFESHVRTARRIADASRPFDFAFVAGDMTDTGQENELDWLIATLAGGTIDPDSGAADDPVPGPGNDHQDPFDSVGIGAPWYAALGNHETLYIGTFAMTDAIRAAAIGDEVYPGLKDVGIPEFDGVRSGYRDGSTPDAQIVTTGKTPPDPRRQILSQQAILQKLFDAPGEPAGHGLVADDVDSDRAYFAFSPLPGKPIRFIVLNTLQQDLGAKVSEGSLGEMDAVQFAWLKTQLDAAADQIVIIGSHHRSSDLIEASKVPAADLAAEIGKRGNVVLHVTGHGHRNDRVEISNAAFESGPAVAVPYWELMLASTVDFPMQSRIFEFVYEGGGYLSIYATNLDHNAAAGTPADRARHLAAAHVFFENDEYRDLWEGERPSRNMLLRVQLPATVQAAVEAAGAWEPTIHSEAILAEFSDPR